MLMPVLAYKMLLAGMMQSTIAYFLSLHNLLVKLDLLIEYYVASLITLLIYTPL